MLSEQTKMVDNGRGQKVGAGKHKVDGGHAVKAKVRLVERVLQDNARESCNNRNHTSHLGAMKVVIMNMSRNEHNKLILAIVMIMTV